MKLVEEYSNRLQIITEITDGRIENYHIIQDWSNYEMFQKLDKLYRAQVNNEDWADAIKRIAEDIKKIDIGIATQYLNKLAENLTNYFCPSTIQLKGIMNVLFYWRIIYAWCHIDDGGEHYTMIRDEAIMSKLFTKLQIDALDKQVQVISSTLR